MTWPDESSSRPDERVAMLPEIAYRNGPKPLPDAVAALQDRILLHTSALTAREITPLPSSIAGLVLAGKTAAAGIKDLRRNHPDLLLLRDPEGYRRALATEDDPFVLEDDEEQEHLFPLTLEEYLQAQRDCGADVVLTPTGYLNVGDSDALRALVRDAARIERDDVVVSVPLDIAWLKNDHITHLIAVLARLDRPKAVFLGGQFDPMERYKAAVENLRRLVAEAGNVAVLRTDLTGFDVMSHGAYAASIGTGGSLRHMIPFGETPFAQQKDPSPSVLFEELMSFHKGSTLAQRFANTRPPVCDCETCHGQALDRFLSRDDRFDAHRHTVHTWASWAKDMHGQSTLADRATWWRNRCHTAVTYTEAVNAQINQPEAFQAPKTLQAWAELPLWSSASGSTRGARTR
ncbi:hypothetical protein BJY24_002796 [Nocardia transvalensis]|uniref:tRNA-guanine family transglycosylase n=1 Tax=Nocardia transvalensis TaxID=37333 RepID=A0A7W9PD53_9NOCA|nr:hypothetical protein [Nocardia transvalensis]MBB5913929.1 hypothetical protein [Nocardia transvalensis]